VIARLSPEQRAALEREEARVLTPAEFDARIAVPVSRYERESVEDLTRWFMRRYPTAGDRLRAMRRRMQQLRQRMG
jgi:hypothetical protein